jgi:hypothetical protein
MTLRKHPKSRFWFAVVRKLSGGWTNLSTKCRKKDAAMRVALEMQAAADEALQGRLAESQARKFISNVFEGVNKKPLPSASLDA